MNGTRAGARELACSVVPYPGVNVVLFPPFTFISEVAQYGGSFAIGAQDVSPHPDGAYTGDISANMLRDCGASHVLIGHSERRQIHGEEDALIARKMEAAAEARLVRVLCVGESLEEQESGKTLDVITRQVETALEGGGTSESTVIAYEPVWAIGSGMVPSAEQIAHVHYHISSLVEEGIRVIYGGSVKPDNAAEILSAQHVDGLLVGGASLNAENFNNIIKIAAG